MEIVRAYVVNISLLVTFGYLINVLYKSVFLRFSTFLRHILIPFMFIAAGYMTMYFGFHIAEDASFDLRHIPLIFGVLVFPYPHYLFLVGLGIGLARLTFGLDYAAWVGATNLMLLGTIAAWLTIRFRRSPEWSVSFRATITVFTINVVNSVYIGVFGVIPFGEYMTRIAPISFPAGVALSFLFLIIVRDFTTEQYRMRELDQTNLLLESRTRDLNAANADLEKKTSELASAARNKSEFLANMSHEWKTPLNSIMLLSQMQSDPEMSREDRRRFSELILKSGDELLGLIDDILDLSKVEAGQLSVDFSKVHLEQTMQAMRDQFVPVAHSKGLSFRVSAEGTLPEFIRTDEMRLQQILRNLLGNAFKFTESGSVELLVSVISTGREQHIQFRVRDTGIGIEEDKVTRIFEPFQQEDGSISRKYGGTGLGLAISSQLCELLDGRLEVDSHKGQGSTFTLTLPLPHIAPLSSAKQSGGE